MWRSRSWVRLCRLSTGSASLRPAAVGAGGSLAPPFLAHRSKNGEQVLVDRALKLPSRLEDVAPVEVLPGASDDAANVIQVARPAGDDLQENDVLGRGHGDRDLAQRLGLRSLDQLAL